MLARLVHIGHSGDFVLWIGRDPTSNAPARRGTLASITREASRRAGDTEEQAAVIRASSRPDRFWCVRSKDGACTPLNKLQLPYRFSVSTFCRGVGCDAGQRPWQARCALVAGMVGARKPVEVVVDGPTPSTTREKKRARPGEKKRARPGESTGRAAALARHTAVDDDGHDRDGKTNRDRMRRVCARDWTSQFVIDLLYDMRDTLPLLVHVRAETSEESADATGSPRVRCVFACDDSRDVLSPSLTIPLAPLLHIPRYRPLAEAVWATLTSACGARPARSAPR